MAVAHSTAERPITPSTWENGPVRRTRRFYIEDRAGGVATPWFSLFRLSALLVRVELAVRPTPPFSAARMKSWRQEVVYFLVKLLSVKKWPEILGPHWPGPCSL